MVLSKAIKQIKKKVGDRKYLPSSVDYTKLPSKKDVPLGQKRLK